MPGLLIDNPFAILSHLSRPVASKIIQGHFFGGQNAAHGSFSWLVSVSGSQH
jgi:hypothetical protein